MFVAAAATEPQNTFDSLYRPLHHHKMCSNSQPHLAVQGTVRQAIHLTCFAFWECFLTPSMKYCVNAKKKKKKKKHKREKSDSKYSSIHFLLFTFCECFRVFCDKCIASLRIVLQFGTYTKYAIFYIQEFFFSVSSMCKCFYNSYVKRGTVEEYYYLNYYKLYVTANNETPHTMKIKFRGLKFDVCIRLNGNCLC